MPDALVTPAPHGAARAPALRGATIAGIGAAVPARIVTNAEVATRLGVDEDWIVTRTGVSERRMVEPGERVVDLAVDAGAGALAAAGVAPGGLDLVVVATMSHDRLAPIAAAEVSARLGATAAGAVDLDAACSGFVTGLGFATAMVEAHRAEAVLLIGADVLSGITDPTDRGTAALFADGAGAAVLVPAPSPGRVGPLVLGADGTRSHLITGEHVIRMQGHDTFKQAVARLAEVTRTACEAAGVALDAIDLFAYHQANARILQALGERLGLDPARVLGSIERYGNTSAATIPIALAEAERNGRLEPGLRVLLAAFGGGLTWAATVVEWGAPA